MTLIIEDNNKYMLENIIRTLEDQSIKSPDDIMLKEQVIKYKESYETKYGKAQQQKGG